MGLVCVLDGLLWATVRYGRQPLFAFVWLLGFWLLGWGIFHSAETGAAIKPNNAFVLRVPEWVACAPGYVPADDKAPPPRWQAGHGSQLGCYRAQPEAASYPAFNAMIYSADTLLPIVDMEMQGFWIPDGGRPGIGQVARGFLWVQIAAGWALSLLAVAGFSGLIKTD